MSRGFATQAAYDAAARRLKMAEASFSSAETSLKDSRERLQYTELRADSVGIITAVGAQPGQVVGAGQMVVRLARTGEKEALFNVAEQMFRTVPRDPRVEVDPAQQSGDQGRGQGARDFAVRRSGDAHVCGADRAA